MPGDRPDIMRSRAAELITAGIAVPFLPTAGIQTEQQQTAQMIAQAKPQPVMLMPVPKRKKPAEAGIDKQSK